MEPESEYKVGDVIVSFYGRPMYNPIEIILQSNTGVYYCWSIENSSPDNSTIKYFMDNPEWKILDIAPGISLLRGVKGAPSIDIEVLGGIKLQERLIVKEIGI
jgi:hypothetical protein